MAESGAAPNGSILTSQWGSLSPHLIARIYPVNRIISPMGAVRWERDRSSPEVHTPLTEGQVENVINWHSPFENTGADQKFGAMSALLQTGGLTPLVMLFKQFTESINQGAVGQSALNGISSLEGRTSMTKLNSTQIFNGSPPMRLTFTAHFRAFADAASEVEDPINQLVRWALPQELAEDGPVLATIKAGDPSLYPSRIPRIIGVDYAGMSFKPFVIDSIPVPLTGPRDSSGQKLSAQLTMSISSLTAIDASGWNEINFRA